jgi:hypothetical protein
MICPVWVVVVKNVRMINIHFQVHMEIYNARKKGLAQRTISLLVIVIAIHKHKKEIYSIIGSCL